MGEIDSDYWSGKTTQSIHEDAWKMKTTYCILQMNILAGRQEILVNHGANDWGFEIHSWTSNVQSECSTYDNIIVLVSVQILKRAEGYRMGHILFLVPSHNRLSTAGTHMHLESQFYLPSDGCMTKCQGDNMPGFFSRVKLLLTDRYWNKRSVIIKDEQNTRSM